MSQIKTINLYNMKTLTINTAGKRANAYISQPSSKTYEDIKRGNMSKEAISVKEAKKLISNKSVYFEGANFKTYRID